MSVVTIGIAMRCVAILADVAAFRFIFGYQFRDMRMKILAVCWGIFAAVLPVMLADFWQPIYLVAPVMCATLFFLFRNMKVGMVFFFEIAKEYFRELCSGVLLLTLGIDSISADDKQTWYTATFWNNLFMLFIISIMAVLLYKQKEKINKIIEQISQWMYFAFGVLIYIPSYKFYTDNTRIHKIMEIQGKNTIIGGLTGILLFVIILLVIFLIYQKKELLKLTHLNERCIAEQTSQYTLLNHKQQELKKFRHDSAAHLRAIFALAQEAGAVKIENYVSELTEVQREMKYINTHHIIGDAVVNQYYDMGLKNGIDVKVAGQFGEGMAVSDTDLCIILTNTVSNAYEAAVRLGKPCQVRITLTGYKDGQFIVITNPSADKPIIIDGVMEQKGSSKADKENHGLGLINIMEAVKRCGGTINWSSEEAEDGYLITTELYLPNGN